MKDWSRREFLRAASAATAGALWGVEGLVARGAEASTARRPADETPGGYGKLVPTAAKNTGLIALALPVGFSYTVFGEAGSRMSDGLTTPLMHDGMAAFSAAGGKIRLVRNQEVRWAQQADAAFRAPSGAYDPKGPGGTVTLIIDPKTRLLERDYMTLAGTVQNCAGGPTPWGSWISCEENTAGPATGHEKAHGYCFEVPSKADRLQANPIPLTAMGRFVHEAIAVDPATGIVYLTEDRETAGFYRFLPKVKGRLAEGGRLQIAAIKDAKNYDTRTGQTVGKTLTVTWVDIEDPDPKNAESDSLTVYKEGQAKGAATFGRLEGCWYGRGSIYIDATDGGDKKLGQVFRYEPTGDAEGRLTLLFESADRAVLAMPDNLCVSPRGGLVVCEDSEEPVQHVRGLSPQGNLFDFAKNVLAGYEDQEFAGACFSPDGSTLFLNIQTPGITCAIWGPWERGAL
jgi:secreted PhoX family phosphatase